MPREIHRILVAARLIDRTHGPNGSIPITTFRIFLAEIEQFDRDDATELDANAARLVDEPDKRNQWGYSTQLGQL